MAAKISKKNCWKFCSLTLALISGSFIVSCGNFSVIDSRGSSSVQPLLSELGDFYSGQHNVEISVQAGGSSLGISSIAQGETMMGNASKTPKHEVMNNPELVQLWKERNLKTISIAKDAIGLVFVSPANTDASQFYVGSNNIENLYTAFAGFEPVSLRLFCDTPGVVSNQIKLRPFARSGGSSSSGTAEAFLQDSNLIPKENITWQPKVKEALVQGQYGPRTTQTNESNAEAYNSFKINAKNKTGSIIYLSLGFIENNLNTILNDGFSVMRYKNQAGGIVEPTKANVQKGLYNWMRPFNTIISLNSHKNLYLIKDFVKWILFSKYTQDPTYEFISKIYNKQGLIELSEDELKMMFNHPGAAGIPIADLIKQHMDKFWTSDFSFEQPKFGILSNGKK